MIGRHIATVPWNNDPSVAKGLKSRQDLYPISLRFSLFKINLGTHEYLS